MNIYSVSKLKLTINLLDSFSKVYIKLFYYLLFTNVSMYVLIEINWF